MPAAMRWRPLLLVAFLAAATLLAFSCLDRPADRPDRGSAAGARTVELRTSDGIALNGRLWTRDPRRMVIYLHEYGDDQTSWWPTAEDGAPSDPSAMTFDFRGHGASEGDHEDVASTPVDARATLAFAAAQGYQRVVLVGAGMGAAAAMKRRSRPARRRRPRTLRTGRLRRSPPGRSGATARPARRPHRL